MYVNGKMNRNGRRGVKENCGGGEFKYDLFDVL
jgi:hypothetical protein